MCQRYYCPQLLADTQVVLDGSEAHHLLHVMRASIGDEVTLFDGVGHQASARVTAKSRQSVTLDVAELEALGSDRSSRLVLAVALPKGDRQKWLVEKLTELGVSRLIPLGTERGNPLPSAAALDKLARSAIEACKQSGRNVLTTIEPPISLADLTRHSSSATARLIAHPGAATMPILANLTGECWIAVGPEGGFSPRESDLLISQGWQPICLAPAILRIETAAVAAAAIVGFAQDAAESGL